MKILHTSDWHLGHRLHEQSQYEEQFRFFKIKCEEQNFDLEGNPEILDAFNEVLQIARES